MKNNITLLLLVLFTFSWQSKAHNPNPTCGNYKVDLIDSDGDGWNGGRLTIYINGNTYLSGITLNSGSGPESFDIPVSQNDILSFVYTAGSYSSENQYIVYDNFNHEIANEGANGTPGNIGDPTIPNGLVACPSCPSPSNLSASNILPNSAELSWTENGSAINWNIEYGSTGFTQGQGTLLHVTSNPYTLTGLLPLHTDYDYYVQADCGGGDVSIWEGPYTLRTGCGIVSSFPYSYGFEDTTANSIGDWSESCWVHSSQSHYFWSPGDSNTNLYGTGPNGAHSGSMFAYTGGAAYSGDITKLTSPVLDLSNLSHPKLSFYYFMLGPSTGTLSVDTYDGTSWTNDVWTLSGPQQNAYYDPWLEGDVYFDNTVTKIRFRAIRAGNAGRSSIDDITIEEGPSCPPPDFLTASNFTTDSATLFWTENGVATAWNIEYGPKGFTQGQGTTVAVSNNPYTLTGLSPATSYDYYVQADCSGGDTSTWKGPYTFSTSGTCGYFRVNLLDSYGDGWNGTGSLSVYVNGTVYLSNIRLSYGHGPQSYNIPVNMNDILSFKYTSGYNDNENQYTVYDNNNIEVANEGANGSVPGNIGDPSIPSGLIACQTCPDPSGLSASNILPDSADISWTENGSATTWNIEYGPVGFTQGQGTIVQATNTPSYTLTGLTPDTYYDLYIQADCGGGDTSFWAGPYNFYTLCSIISTFPYNYGFEDNTSNPYADWTASCWSANPENLTNYVYSTGPYRWTPNEGETPYSYSTGTSSAHSGLLYAYTVAHGSNPADTELISPVFDLSSLSNPQMSFYYHMHGTDIVSLSVDTFDGSTWTNDVWMLSGQQQTSRDDPWAEATVYFSNSVTQIRFRAIRGSGFRCEIAVDDILLEEGPSCRPPTSLSTSNITGDSVDLSWTENGSATTWNIEYGPTGFTQGQGTIVQATSTPSYTLTGLSSTTDYDFYVQADCGGGDLSTWEGPFSFSTICDTVTTFPYNYGFENTTANPEADWSSSCWYSDPENTGSNSYSGPFRWTPTDSATPDSGTGPNGPHSGNMYAYTEASGSNDGDVAELTSPLFDFSGFNLPQLSFYYFMYGSNLGTLSVDTYDGTTWTNDVWTMSGYQQISSSATWIQATVPLNNTVKQIRFRAIRGNGYDSDIAIDDILIENITCPSPVLLTASNMTDVSAELSWTENGSATTWNIEYGPSGFTQGQGTTVATSSNPYTLTGLLPNSEYDIYVQSDCGGGDTSDWIGTVSFTTNCSTVTSFPYTEDFENNGNIPDCWKNDDTDAGGDWEFSRSNYYGMSGDHTTGNGNYALINDHGIPVSDSPFNLITPTFDLSATSYILKYWYWIGNNSAPNPIHIDVSTDGGATWTQDVYVHDHSFTGSWMENIIDLSTFNTTNVVIRFRAESIHAYNNSGIDDVSIMEKPSCIAPGNIYSSNITAHSVELSWSEFGSATTWNIEYGPSGFTQGQGTTVTASSNPFTLTGLTSNTVYDYYIQSDCGNTNGSDWKGTYTFTTLPACGDTFFDDGGPHGNYSANLNQTITIYPDNQSDKVAVTFNNFDMQNGIDGMMVYNGADTNAPIIDSGSSYGRPACPNGAWTGAPLDTYSALGQHFISSDASGALTFVFTSNSGYQFAGWEAVVSCTSCLPPSDLTASNITDSQADLSWIETGTATVWNIEFGETGFTPTGTPTNSGINNPFTLTGLNSNTTYDYYVQADCGGENSFWAGPYSFTTMPACGDTFYDDGGHSGNYSANLNQSITIYPDNPGEVVTVTFNYFDMENGWDGMMVYNGPDTNAPIFDSGSTFNRPTCPNGAWTGINSDPYNASGHSFISTDPSGALTFAFTSNEHNQTYGWQASVSCTSCPMPSDLTASNITISQAELSWNENGTATAWNIEYGTAGFTQGQGTVLNGITSNPYILSGLIAGTSYDYYLQKDCGGGDTSDWEGPYTFKTLCSTVSTFPYHYGFEDTTQNTGGNWSESCWSANPQDTGSVVYSGPYRWTPNQGSTSTGSTGPGSANRGSMYAYTEASGSGNGDVAELISPILDLSSLIQPELSFYYFMYGNQTGSLHVDTYNGSTWTNNAWTLSGEQQTSSMDSWLQATLSIPNTVSKIRFRAIRGSGYHSDIAIDDIMLQDSPTCLAPSDLTVSNVAAFSAVLSWAENNAASTWSIEYGHAGFTQGQGTVITTTDNPKTLTGLSSNTSYDYYVQTDCGGGDFSNWTGPVTFTTSCTTVTSFPYTQDFENDGNIPGCWINDDSDAGGEWQFETSNFHGPSTDHTSGTGYYALLNDLSTLSSRSPFNLITPVLDLSATSYILKYWYWIGTDGAINPIHIDISTDGGTTWISDIYTHDKTISETWTENVIDLSAYNSTNVVIRFRGESVNGYGTNNSGIDDITVMESPSCLAPTNLSASNISANSADLSWTEFGSASTWNIELGVTGFTPTGTPTNSGVTNPFTVTGLNSITTYDYYVQSDCGGNDTSEWVGPYTFSTSPGCGDTFYDDGGATGNYSPNLNQSFTIYPENPGEKVTVTFNSFDMQNGYDGMLVYNGADTNASIIDSGFSYGGPACPNSAWTGNSNDIYSAEGKSFTSTDVSGALTFVFTSNSSNQRSGWEATVNCSTCPPPSSAIASNITNSQADLSWTEYGTATTWNIELGVSGFTPTGTASHSGVTNPFTVTGLNSNTTYDYYVQSDCGSASIWTGPYTFKTAPACGESFYDDGGPTGYYSNNYYQSFTVYPENVGGVVTVTFNNFKTEEGYDSMMVYNGPDTNAPIFNSGSHYTRPTCPDGAWTGNPGDSYAAYMHSFTSTDPSGALTFVFTTDNSNQEDGWDAYVSCVSCLSPSELTASSFTTSQAELSWENSGIGTEWNIEYGVAGFTQGQGTVVSVTSNPYTLTGLNSNTFYDYYVQTDCGNGNTSDWVGPYTFVTAPVCGDTFYDNGGANGNYSPNLNQIYTIYPDTPGDVVTVTFNGFNMDEGNDGMLVYNGVDTNAPLIDSGSTYGRMTCPNGAWTGGPGDSFSAHGQSFTSTDLSGALTFVFISNTWTQNTGWEAEITCAPPTGCPDPTGLTLTGLTPTTADLSWNAIIGASGYNWEIVPVGNGQGNGVVDSGNTNGTTVTATGLSLSTTYDAYVQNDCGSAYTGPFTFTTVCDSQTTLDEGFEGGVFPSCWNQDSEDDFDWTVHSGATSTNNTGPNAAHEGTYYIYIESSSASNGDKAIIYSPPVDLSGFTHPSLDFWYHMYESGTYPNGAIDISISNDWGITYTSIWTESGNQGNYWHNAIVNLPDYISQTVIFRITGTISTSGSSYLNDLAIDAFKIEEGIYCPAPSNLSANYFTSTSADLYWTVGGNETAWNIEYGPAGFTQGQGTVVTATNNHFTLSGLTASTAYDYYVQADCGGGETSTWVGPFSFSTSGTCGVFRVVLINSFGNGWNGNTLTVYKNGTPYLTDISLSSGYGPESYYIPTDINDVLSFDYSGASWHNGNEYKVYDNNRQLVADQGTGNDAPDDIGDPAIPTGLESCPTCPMPTRLTVASVANIKADLSWRENGSASTWNIEYGLAGFSPGYGTIINGVTSNDYYLSGLSPNTTYSYYVQSDCGNGDSSMWAGPFVFTTAPGCGDTFYDDGGPNGNYSENMDKTFTIYPENPGDLVMVDFNSFNMTEGWDSMMVYDGPDSHSPIISSGSTYNGITCPNGAWTGGQGEPYSADGHSFAATNGSGALTFVFKTNDHIQGSGWEATILCTTCPHPSDLTASNIRGSYADLSWTENGSATSWNIEYGPTGFTQGQGTIINGVTSNPYTITGLDSYTNYDYYVQADCGNGDTSIWAGPYSFKTQLRCGDTFYDDGGPNGNYSSNLNLTWTIYPDSPGDVVSVTFNSFETQNGWDGLMIYNGPNINYPIFDSGSRNNHDTEYCPDGAWTGCPGCQYSAQGHTFTATNATGALTFVFKTGGVFEFSGWEAIISCTSCIPPSSLTATNITTSQAELSWTENGTATNWNIEYGSSGFSQGQGTMLTGITSNSYLLSGLNAATTFDYYVQADCGSGDISPWAGPYSFTTGYYVTPTSSYNYDFEDLSSNINSDWTGSSWTSIPSNSGTRIPGQYKWIHNSGSTPTDYTGPSSAYNGSIYAYTEATDSNPGDIAKLISPVFDLTSLSQPELSFYYHMYGQDMGTLNVDTYNGTTWTNAVWSIQGQQQTSETDSWSLASLVISNTVKQIRFRAIRGNGNRSDMAIDNFTIQESLSGINELTNVLGIYPNPTTGQFVIKSHDLDNANVFIYTLTGKEIYKGIIDNDVYSINLKNAVKGVYLVKIISEGKLYVNKLIVK